MWAVTGNISVDNWEYAEKKAIRSFCVSSDFVRVFSSARRIASIMSNGIFLLLSIAYESSSEACRTSAKNASASLGQSSLCSHPKGHSWPYLDYKVALVITPTESP